MEDESPDVRPEYDPTCYLCPGNERAGGQRNPAYTATYAFDNDFPALLPEGGAVSGETPELLAVEPVIGQCRVICFSPRHDLTLAEMAPGDVRAVVDTWAEETRTIGEDPRVGYVQVFENKGELMGCSNPHPHCQVWATGHVPLLPERKSRAQQAYLERKGRDLLGDYLETELAEGERIVCRNDHWVALVPWWAVWPFELMLVPVRRVPDLSSSSDTERDALSEIVRSVGTRYDNLFRTSFPYSMGFHGRPTDGREHPWWRLHAVFLPPLLRSATVRKFLVGYELTAEPQRDLTAEQAAARLREQSETHYRRGERE